MSAIPSPDRIALSFLALTRSDFTYRIFRKALADTDSAEEGTRFLPSKLGAGPKDLEACDRKRYIVSLNQIDGYESATLGAWVDPGLTMKVLDQALEARSKRVGLEDQLERPDRDFVKKLGFVLQRHPQGVREVIWARAYSLKVLGKFGFLLDFALRVPPTSPITDKKRLELSLTHKNGRTNEDFYLDHYRKIERFLQSHHADLRHLVLHDGSEVEIEEKLSVIRSFSLSRRIFIFSGNKEGKSPFFGLRNHGPLLAAPRNTRLAFFFLDVDRSKSQDLFRALRGDTYATFPGMEQMFGIPIGKQNVSGIEVAGFGDGEVRRACETLRSQYPDEQIVPVVIAPMSKYSSDEETKAYYAAKHAFLSERLSSQFVDRKRIGDRRALQWSVSNIGLGIFAKMGGIPWRLMPSTEKCLVVGIGQAHREINKKIERYFAYSVLADSSGIYEKIKLLGSTTDPEEYLANLKSNLREVLLSHKGQYESFVLHLTFSMKKREIAAIKELLQDLKAKDSPDSEFVALKFNDHNDFFGFSVDHNSRIPYEGAVAPLSRREYLLWFSGLGLEDRKAPKKPERPVHVTVLYPDAFPESDLKRVLQDSMNIAGANWRGFNAKSLPISIYYAKLIADYYGHFREANLTELDLENLSPWFL